MKHFTISYLLLLISFTLFGQTNDPWFSFWNKDTTLIGFKDQKGAVKIEPKFSGITNTGRFEDIIAVMEEKNGAWNSYYLTKTGKIMGRDSLYFFDNTADCENEGFIRFHDRTTDKMGLFNKNGELAVPAQYNFTTPVRNGMIVALTGATKKQMGEHYSWEGGKLVLIDTSNNILIDNFVADNNLNFYSLLVTPQPHPDSLRQNFKSVNGQYYSFISYDLEFLDWLKSALLRQFSKNSLLNCSNGKIGYWKEPRGWTREAKRSFIDRNYALIKPKLLALNTKHCDYTIFDESLNPFIYEAPEYKKYFNNCGQSKDWMYPVKSIVINYHDKKDLVQDHFEFIRTDKGYKLINVTIKKGKLK